MSAIKSNKRLVLNREIRIKNYSILVRQYIMAKTSTSINFNRHKKFTILYTFTPKLDIMRSLAFSRVEVLNTIHSTTSIVIRIVGKFLN